MQYVFDPVLISDRMKCLFGFSVILMAGFQHEGDSLRVGRSANANVSKYPIQDNIEAECIWTECAAIYFGTLRFVVPIRHLFRSHT